MKRNSNISRNEDGSSLLSLIVLCGALVLYVKYAYFQLFESQGVVADVVLFIMLTAILFCFFGGLCLWFKGGKSNRRVVKENKSKMKELATLIDETQAKLLQVETGIRTHKVSIQPAGTESLSAIRSILSAMRERYNMAGSLVTNRKKISNIEAWEILNGNLEDTKDCYGSLIQGGDSSLDIPANNLSKKLEELFQNVTAETLILDVSIPNERMVA